MKLYPLSPTSKSAVNIGKISRKFRLKILTPEHTPLAGIIVLADGTPDDYVVALLSYRLNGEKVLGVVKPEEKRLGVFNIIPTILNVLREGKIAVLIDQENEDLNTIFSEVSRRLSGIGTIIRDIVKEEKLWVYKCEHSIKKFQLIVIVNGLSEYTFKKHSIEDHLLKAAEKLLKVKIDEEDPKEGWSKLRDRQDEVFRQLKDAKNLDDIFPQQIKGLKLLHNNPSFSQLYYSP